MKLLVVGTVPPPASAFSTALGLSAASALSDGSLVDVLSPDPRSAAHLYGNLSGLGLAVHLARRWCRYDALVLRIEPGLPLDAKSSRNSRALALIGLGAVLLFWRDVTLRLDSPIPLPGGVGGRSTRLLWRSASRVIVANDHDREELLKVPGLDASIIVVEPIPEHRAPATSSAWTSLGEEPTREMVLGAVRARAASHRAVNDARVVLGREPNGPVTDSIFSDEVLPSMPATGVARLVAARAGRVLGRVFSY